MLHEYFPNCVSKKLPNNYIHEIIEVLAASNVNNIWIFRTDISNFYPSIPHEELIGSLYLNRVDPLVISVIKKAIKNETVPFNYKRKDKHSFKKNIGIPQGLQISNILANIYLRDFDRSLKGVGTAYFRYVDDILIISIKHEKDLRAEVEKIFWAHSLKLNCYKTTYTKLTTQEFEYLGYKVQFPKISIRDSSKNLFIQKIINKITWFKKATKNSKGINYWLYKDKELLKKRLICELNEKITGVIHGNRKYGWISFFIKISDEKLLYQIDHIIETFFLRMEEFNFTKPRDLKRLVRAYNELKRPSSRYKYITNYNTLDTFEKKLNYLKGGAFIDPSRQYTPEEIDSIFNSVISKRLSELEMDIGFIS